MTIKSEIRKSYFLNKYVIITPGRAKRPRDVQEETVVAKKGFCPFCPESVAEENIVDVINKKNSKDWQVLSIKNIFPAVSLDNKKAYGTQEVVVDSPIHDKELASLSKEEIKDLLRMYIKRTKGLMLNKELDYILCFKNQGSKAGASIAHAHSQIFATQIIPADLKEEHELSKEYQLKNKICPYCDIIKKESQSERNIFTDQHMTAFTPYASRYHYEAWIFPLRHLDNITLLNEDELESLAVVLKKILVKLQGLGLSFNYYLHNVVSNDSQHFYIKIQPRDSVWAGVELGSGLVINSISPEMAAEYYKS